MTELGQAIDEQWSGFEMHREIGKTAAERMTPGVDDLRAGKNQVHKTDMQKIVRHLVGKERAPQFSVRPRGFQVLFAERFQCGSVEFREDARITRTAVRCDFFADVLGE